MKKVIRILIPLVLAIAIILCVAWYLFIYDREFTRDMLLLGARYFEEQGKHNLSSQLYDLAYTQVGNNDAVAIELADQHRKSGNYTKAEYTLSKAIADGGGTDLYVALCQIFMEQDKVLDAVNLLNNITNPDIKSQIDAMRPAAPTCTPDPGFYNQYISVTFSADVPTLLVNTEGEYPSVHKDLYQASVKLQEGENTVYAVAVSKDCLVSPVSIFGFTVGGVIEEVVFQDDILESAIRQQLAVSPDTVLYSNDLWGITEFTVPEGTQDYSALRYMAFLENLSIHNGAAGQLSVLSHLANLSTLSITNTTVRPEELSIISTLPNLTALTLNNCGLSTISGLENAETLQYLDLGNNTIRNLEPLSVMSGLTHLNLQHNAVSNTSVLSDLAQISTLDLSYNNLKSLSSIGKLTNLTVLNVAHNELTSITGIENCTALERLHLDSNRIEDISSLSVCTAMSHLYVSDNALTSLDGLADLVNLTNLDFANNQVSSLPAFAEDSKLVNIDGSHNLLETLDPLSGLKNLNNVFMDYNAEIFSVDCLKNCPVLIQVNVYGTKVTEVTMLTDQSVIVHYNPTDIQAE